MELKQPPITNFFVNRLEYLLEFHHRLKHVLDTYLQLQKMLKWKAMTTAMMLVSRSMLQEARRHQ